MIQTEEKQERVILVGVALREIEAEETSLDELEALAETAGAKTCGKMIQSRESFHPGTYIGKGKIEELQALIEANEADGIICDDELSPAQIRNLREALGVKVMDRTLLILDIFAAHAATAEGKVQVEIAQQRYLLTHLTGLGTSLSRLGGGIGTRGPGEKKLEMDRRYIRDRISQLKKELEEIGKRRDLLRKNRIKSGRKTAAIVGYTNAGKSTMLNTMTDAKILEADQLFATLDPTTRMLEMENGRNLYLTDTVGFISKLPHHLVEAFKSTLEEAVYADFLIHVVDVSNPNFENQMETVYQTLHSLGADGKKIITVFNKMDRISLMELPKDTRAEHELYVSMKKREGLEGILDAIEEVLSEDQIFIDRVFPYDQAGKIALIRDYGTLLEEEYTGEGIHVKAYVTQELYGRI